MRFLRRLAFPLLLAFAGGHALAANPVEAVTEGGSVAQRMVTLSLKQEVADNDSRVLAADRQLKAAAQATGETEMAVAAACTRAARFIFDATRSPATPLDVLDGLLCPEGACADERCHRPLCRGAAERGRQDARRSRGGVEALIRRSSSARPKP